MNVLQAVGHLQLVATEVVVCKLDSTTHPVTLEQISGVVSAQWGSITQRSRAGTPQVVSECMATINDQARCEHRCRTVHLQQLLRSEDFGERSLHVVTVARSTQQTDTGEELTVVEDVLFNVCPIIHRDGVGDVVAQPWRNTVFWVTTFIDPDFLCLLDVLQLLHAVQVGLEDTAFVGHDREGDHHVGTAWVPA